MISKKPTRTSDLLRQIVRAQKEDADDRITFGEFVARLKDRAFGLGILAFALPNAIPLGIPGISSICAVPIAIFALQMMLGQKQVWLPGWLANRSISEKIFSKAVFLCLPFLKVIELFIRPRLSFVTSPQMEKFVGFLIIILAGVIFLPIPLGNFFPALCMCILAIGLLERDGLVIAGGIVFSAVVLAGMYYVIVLVLKALFHGLLKIIAL